MGGLQRVVVVLVIGLLFVLVQGTVLRTFLPELLVPNFILILVVFIGFYDISVRGAILVFLLGFLMDLESGTLLGPWAGAYTALFGVLASLSQRMFVESFFAAFLAVFVCGLLSDLIHFILIYEFMPGSYRALSFFAYHGTGNSCYFSSCLFDLSKIITNENVIPRWASTLRLTMKNQYSLE